MFDTPLYHAYLLLLYHYLLLLSSYITRVTKSHQQEQEQGCKNDKTLISHIQRKMKQSNPTSGIPNPAMIAKNKKTEEKTRSSFRD